MLQPTIPAFPPRRLPACGTGLLPALGAVLLSSCGNHPPTHAANAPEQPARFRQVATVEALPSSPPEVFDTGPQIRRKMLALIASARDYILIDSFLVLADKSSRPVLEALKEKHRSGVRIHVVGDSSSRFVSGDPGWLVLREAGIPCAEYNPIRACKLPVAPLMLARDHRKFWVIDGKVLFLGGANITATSLKALENGGNHDLMVAIKSPRAVARMVRSFVDVWNESSPRKLRTGDFAVPVATPRETKVWLYDQNSPGGRDQVIITMMDSLFAIARKEVWLIQPYCFVTPGLLKRIRTLTARGVAVHVVLSGRFHASRFRYASYYGIKDLLGAGARVSIYNAGRGTLHAKAFVVDGRCISIGSANLNHRSYRLSKEANLVFDDPQSARRLLPSIETIRSRCRPVGMEEARRYRNPGYFLTWLAMQILG